MTNAAFNVIPNLADRYQSIKLEIEALQRLLDDVKEQIEATKLETIEGNNAIVTITSAPRTAVSSKLVKELLSAEDVALVSETTIVKTFRVKSKVNVVQA